jgi:diguanylate cyclase (GGDEF)-like protein/PAS domain S-box-containing protein
VGGRGERADFRVARAPGAARRLGGGPGSGTARGQPQSRDGGAPVPEGEERRLAVLADYEILDTPPEQGFDELVQLASDLCDAPVALVGLVGRDRVWVKAGIGLAGGAAFPELRLFTHVVDHGELLEIGDVRADDRFTDARADDRFTDARADVRFFAGAPIVTDDGTVLGALCVLDPAPRSLSERQRADLRALAHQVVAQLSLRRALIRAQRAEQALQSREEQFRTIAGAAREWIHDLAPGGTISYSNAAVESILGFTSADVVGRVLVDFAHPDDSELLAVRLAEVDRDGHDAVIPPVRLVDDLGGYRWLEGTALPICDPSGAPTGARLALRDVTDRIEMQQQLIDLAGLDDLTALLNRRGFLRSAEDQLKVARRRETPLVLLFIDVDGLKTVNDSDGHAAGDLLLVDTANLLRATFRESDVVARVGGDEFCVLLTSDASDAWLAVRRLLVAIDEHHEHAVEQRPFRLSLSIGSATFEPDHPRTIEQLMQLADHAMYANKRAKRAQLPEDTRSA